jgi:hypothetical protein
MGNQVIARWKAILPDFTAEFIRANPNLAPFFEDAAVVLHGSTCDGIDDAVSDLDLWLILSPHDLSRLDGVSPTRFLGFRLEKKLGHFNAVSDASFVERVRHCDMTLIAELRNAMIIRDPLGVAQLLIAKASQPMPEAVRRAFFQYHYVEHRGDDRAADSPLDRGDPVAALAAQTAALGHALRAAMVLHGEPYPYSKWLYRKASQTPTGRALAPKVEQWIDLLSQNALRGRSGSDIHPLARKMTEIRLELTEAAHAAGIDGPWLKEWWLHIDAARAGIQNVEWQRTC